MIVELWVADRNARGLVDLDRPGGDAPRDGEGHVDAVVAVTCDGAAADGATMDHQAIGPLLDADP